MSVYDGALAATRCDADALAQRKTSVYITVDVETSMGGAWQYLERKPLPVEKRIFCETRGKRYGIPLLVEELERYGFRATFFTEVFLSCCLGRDAAAKVFDYLLSRGQDVQLHTHPTFRAYGRAAADGRRRSRVIVVSPIR